LEVSQVLLQNAGGKTGNINGLGTYLSGKHLSHALIQNTERKIAAINLITETHISATSLID
jgi:hypothetical protein